MMITSLTFISNNVYSKKIIVSLNSAAMVLANKINQTRSKKKKLNKAEEAYKKLNKVKAVTLHASLILLFKIFCY